MLCDSCRPTFCVCKGSGASRCRHRYANLEPPASAPIFLLEKLEPLGYAGEPNRGLLILKAQWKDSKAGSDKRGTSFIYSNASVLERGPLEEGGRLEKAVYNCLHNIEWHRFTSTPMYRDFIAAGGITLPALCLQDESTDSESEKGKQAAAASPPSVVDLSLPPLPPARVEKAPTAVAESSGTALSRPPKRPRTGTAHRHASASSRKASPPKPTATDMSTLS